MVKSPCSGCRGLACGAELGAVVPAEQEQSAQEEQGSGKNGVSGPVEPSPEGDDIECSQRGEQEAADPFPSPGNRQDEQEEAGWDEVDQQRNERVPEALVFAEHVQREETDQAGE